MQKNQSHVRFPGGAPTQVPTWTSAAGCGCRSACDTRRRSGPADDPDPVSFSLLPSRSLMEALSLHLIHAARPGPLPCMLRSGTILVPLPRVELFLFCFFLPEPRGLLWGYHAFSALHLLLFSPDPHARAALQSRTCVPFREIFRAPCRR